jgi:hypothetical protein
MFCACPPTAGGLAGTESVPEKTNTIFGVTWGKLTPSLL